MLTEKNDGYLNPRHHASAGRRWRGDVLDHVDDGDVPYSGRVEELSQGRSAEEGHFPGDLSPYIRDAAQRAGILTADSPPRYTKSVANGGAGQRKQERR